MTIVVEYCKIILDNRRVYSGGDMVKQVIVTADKVRKRKRYATIVKIALLSLLLLLAVFYFILQIIYNEGRFTISLDSNKTLESGIAIYESLNDPQPKRKLEADAISFMDNISEKWLPENVNTEADGSHNGENYIAYSFYVENQGKETLHYWYEIIVEDINKNVNLENGFGLQSVDEIKETDFTSCDDIFNELFNDLASSESSEKTNIQNIEKEENVQENSDSQLEELLNNYNEKQEQKNKIITSKELDELMDNILNSIIEESQSEQENINQSEINQETKDNNFEISGLPAKKHSSSVEDFIDKCIDGTYFFFKNIWNSCKKVGVLIKTKTHELLGEDK